MLGFLLCFKISRKTGENWNWIVLLINWSFFGFSVFSWCPLDFAVGGDWWSWGDGGAGSASIEDFWPKSLILGSNEDLLYPSVMFSFRRVLKSLIRMKLLKIKPGPYFCRYAICLWWSIKLFEPLATFSCFSELTWFTQRKRKKGDETRSTSFLNIKSYLLNAVGDALIRGRHFKKISIIYTV